MGSRRKKKRLLVLAGATLLLGLGAGGAYLVRHLGHCGECHSPRGALGAIDPARELAGSRSGPDGKKVPNITPHDKDGIGDWSAIDLTFFFETGILPDGDVAGGAMGCRLSSCS